MNNERWSPVYWRASRERPLWPKTFALSIRREEKQKFLCWANNFWRWGWSSCRWWVDALMSNQSQIWFCASKYSKLSKMSNAKGMSRGKQINTCSTPRQKKSKLCWESYRDLTLEAPILRGEERKKERESITNEKLFSEL